ncbi:PepSY domain-containing protein [Methylotenera sp. G11]|uniref:PepSY domain-containing protein n=1 Tax=Methylotenera sp. G11 TaxID=1506585 RepID=UPI00068A787D|nr:PepSY domain-containing protein [Methylotenera sp. G11]
MTARFNISKLPATAGLWLAALTVLLVLAVSFVWADESPLTARKLSEAGLILPLEKITSSAKAIKPGKILETELELKNGAYIYEVEILDNKSQVWELKLDAKTGKLLKMERDD